MKEIEEFAKAISIGMKALAKMIESAADQLEEHAQAQREKDETQEVRTPPQKKAESKKRAKAEKPETQQSPAESAPQVEAEKTPEKNAPQVEAEKVPAKKAPKAKATKAKDAKTQKSSGKNLKKGKKEARKPSDTESVYLHIQAAKEGIHLDELQKATGFNKKKLYNIVYRLKDSGKIKNPDKGIYTAA